MLINGRNINMIKLINETTPFKVYATESTLVPLNCNHVMSFISKSYVVNDFSFLNLIPKFSNPRVNETAFDLYIR